MAIWELILGCVLQGRGCWPRASSFFTTPIPSLPFSPNYLPQRLTRVDCNGLSCHLPSGWALPMGGPEGNEKWVVEGGNGGQGTYPLCSYLPGSLRGGCIPSLRVSAPAWRPRNPYPSLVTSSGLGMMLVPSVTRPQRLCYPVWFPYTLPTPL